MRSYAVIPPMMLDSFERRHFFNNNNGLIEDPMSEYKERLVFISIRYRFEACVFCTKMSIFLKQFVSTLKFIEDIVNLI